MAAVISALMGVNVMTGDEFGAMQEEKQAKESDMPGLEPIPQTTTEPMKQPMEEPKHPEAKKGDNEARAKSNAEKDLGNALYTKKQFDEALQHYDTAFELDPTNVAVLTNKSAALYEAGRYQECLDVAMDAVEKARDVRADFKLVAKAFSRIASAHMKMDNLQEAIKYYQKSLTEHRTPDVLQKLRDAEKLQKERELEAYKDPALANAAREKGNEYFKAGNWPEAVKSYSEAIKRDPNDPRAWSNRASCYLKLMSVPQAESDVERCLMLDPTFVKAYIRKAQCQMARKDYFKAMEILTLAKEKDADNKNAVEIGQQMNRCQQMLYTAQNSNESPEEVMARAQRDPEIIKILQDPIMMQILKQMEQDPSALKEYVFVL